MPAPTTIKPRVERIERRSFLEFAVEAGFESEPFANHVRGRKRQNRRGEKRGVQQAEGEKPSRPLPCERDQGLGGFSGAGNLVRPCAFRVAAQQTMMKNTMTMQEMLPTSTSMRACLYWRGPTRFSTKPACK